MNYHQPHQPDFVRSLLGTLAPELEALFAQDQGRGLSSDPADLLSPEEEASEFLWRLHPAGPWAITAIIPDGSTATEVFGPDTEADLHAFIRKHDGKRNLYYSVNRPRPGITKKARKDEIERATCLHVDVDPKDGETPEAAKERAAKALRDSGLPTPTLIVDSGNGVQFVWRLGEP